MVSSLFFSLPLKRVPEGLLLFKGCTLVNLIFFFAEVPGAESLFFHFIGN